MDGPQELQLVLSGSLTGQPELSGLYPNHQVALSQASFYPLTHDLTGVTRVG